MYTVHLNQNAQSVYLIYYDKMTCSSSEGWQYGTESHGLQRNASWQKLLSGIVYKWLTEPRRFFLKFVSVLLSASVQRVGVSRMRDFWIHTSGCLLWEKLNLSHKNTCGKVRGAWRVKIQCITFKNWIMYGPAKLSAVKYSSVKKSTANTSTAKYISVK